ncbi:aldose 1-epimerase family protein [Nocardiopsis sp. MG754419]|uniref:aldose 1-epimerase family protein n=1 Tax=Nocardiopsis sp. MG754419 TaxID=2259865 RepID=UPI001BA4F64F|nr:aldose 1-epimerase family protein [Nocardiopsis sp. MG754419]MBR8741594.1 aldose epimerase [Nocardiopsis sp. MG754419]
MGEAFELRSGDYRARVDRIGAGLQALTWHDRDLVWPYTRERGPLAFQGQLLAPWPNRVAEGRYTFQGADYRLEVDDAATGSAIHGLAHALEWSPVRVEEHAVTLRLAFTGTPGYPFPLELTAEYRLAEDGLTVTLGALNTGTGDAPFGVGFHPYLTLGRPLDELSARGELTVSADADHSQPTDGNLIPRGAPEPVAGGGFDLRRPGRDLGSTVLDTAFTDLTRDARGRAWVRLGGPDHRVALWAGPGYDWLQLFSADTLGGDAHRAHLAAEPMTCPPDALNSGTDLLVLAPGEAVERVFGILAEPVHGAHADRATTVGHAAPGA